MFNPQAFDIEPREFSPLEDGVYVLAMKDSKMSVSQAGNDVVTATFVVLVGDRKNAEIRFQNYVLTEKAGWRFAQLCRAIDPKMTAFNVKDDESRDHRLAGRPFKAEVALVEETYNGKVRQKNEIKTHLPLSDDERRQLQQVLAAAAPSVDDDIPF